MNEKMRTSISFNLTKPQREVFDLICKVENRSVTQQVEVFLKVTIKEWMERHKGTALIYVKDKKDSLIPKIIKDPTILLK